MTYEAFETWNIRKEETWIALGRAKGIIKEYRTAGIMLTLRQLYYQFVARGYIENSEKSYKRLGKIVARGRQAGRLDWEAIEDRGRQPVEWSQFPSMEACLERAMRGFRLERLKGQNTYVELWVEKDALASVLEPIAARYHVTLMANRGYSSASAMRASAERIRKCVNAYGSKDAVILYIGDHDPSGRDMIRDIRERGDLFLNGGQLMDWSSEPGKGVPEKWEDARKRKPNIPFSVEALALTMDQIEEYDPPPNPTKLRDSRAEAYVQEFGYESWEVDALPPTVLREIIEEALDRHLDVDKIEDFKAEERELRTDFETWLQTRDEEEE